MFSILICLFLLQGLSLPCHQYQQLRFNLRFPHLLENRSSEFCSTLPTQHYLVRLPGKTQIFILPSCPYSLRFLKKIDHLFWLPPPSSAYAQYTKLLPLTWTYHAHSRWAFCSPYFPFLEFQLFIFSVWQVLLPTIRDPTQLYLLCKAYRFL